RSSTLVVMLRLPAPGRRPKPGAARDGAKSRVLCRQYRQRQCLDFTKRCGTVVARGVVESGRPRRAHNPKITSSNLVAATTDLRKRRDFELPVARFQGGNGAPRLPVPS